MSTWVWYFRKWRVEDGLAIPDPVYLESDRSTRILGRPGKIITSQGVFTQEQFLSRMLGRPVTSIGRDVADGELDTEIAHVRPGEYEDAGKFLFGNGLRLDEFIEHTDGLPQFDIVKLSRQGELLSALRKIADRPAILGEIVEGLARGYKVGVTA